MSIGHIQTSFKKYRQSLTMLHSARPNDSKRILEICLMEKYLKVLVQGKNCLENSREQDCVSIKIYMKKLNTMH